MADGEVTIKLDDASITALDAKAKAAGLTPDDYARQVVQEALGTIDHWAIARARAAEFDRTGEGMTVDEAFDRLEAMVAERRAKRV
jgi:hypothetical protein